MRAKKGSEVWAPLRYVVYDGVNVDLQGIGKRGPYFTRGAQDLLQTVLEGAGRAADALAA